MSAWQKVQLWLWGIFSVCLSIFISLVFFVFMSLRYSEMHNISTAGGHAITERDIILSDITLASGKAAALIFIIAVFLFWFHQEICGSLNESDRRFKNLSGLGLRLFGLNALILCVGPIAAGIQYYLERVPYFP